jgi:hypothetical protein
MAKKLFTAIAFYPALQNKKPLKYRNISNLVSFEIYASKKGIAYINYYDKDTRAYYGRKWLI